MSKIFDALQRAEADGVAARHERSDTRQAGNEELPPGRPGFTGWWKGLIVGIAVGALGAAIVRSYLLDSQPPPAPAVPLDLASSQEPTNSADLGVTPSEPESRAEAAGDAGTGFTALSERPAEVAELGLSEPVPPSAIPTVIDRRSSPARAPAPARSAAFRIQVGAFRERDNATGLAQRLQRLHYPATIERGRTASAPWVVRIGAYPDRRSAEATLRELERAGFRGIIVSTGPAPRVRGGGTRARSGG